MIGTDNLFKSACNQEARFDTRQLMTRDGIRKVLVARGVNPHEARLRIDSLSDAEIELISEKAQNPPAGGGVAGFIVIIGGVILALIIIIEYTSEIKMFPELHFMN